MILVIYHFGFEGGIGLLIAPVPVHCFLITLISACKFGNSYTLHTWPVSFETIPSQHAVKAVGGPLDSYKEGL